MRVQSFLQHRRGLTRIGRFEDCRDDGHPRRSRFEHLINIVQPDSPDREEWRGDALLDLADQFQTDGADAGLGGRVKNRPEADVVSTVAFSGQRLLQ